MAAIAAKPRIRPDMAGTDRGWIGFNIDPRFMVL